MNKPHKHAAVIKAWADGAQIEMKYRESDEWETVYEAPAWNVDRFYRVKPDIVMVNGVKCVKPAQHGPVCSPARGKHPWTVSITCKREEQSTGTIYVLDFDSSQDACFMYQALIKPFYDVS